MGAVFFLRRQEGSRDVGTEAGEDVDTMKSAIFSSVSAVALIVTTYLFPWHGYWRIADVAMLVFSSAALFFAGLRVAES